MISQNHKTKLPVLCNSTHVSHVISSKLTWPNLKSKISPNRIKNTNFDTEKFGDHSTRIMVVVDSSRESKVALQWALSNSLHVQDTLVLVCVIKKFNDDDQHSKMDNNLRAYQLLYYLRNFCWMRKPGVQVEVALLESNEKGPVIVEEARRQRVSLLILEQKKRRMLLWRILRNWVGKGNRRGDVDQYCIQNASCMTVAVRKKSNKLGGYLITTKHHKNFWLLA